MGRDMGQSFSRGVILSQSIPREKDYRWQLPVYLTSSLPNFSHS